MDYNCWNSEILVGQVVDKDTSSYRLVPKVCINMKNPQVIVNFYNCRNVEELLSIFAQARDNGSTLKVVGGSYRIGSTNSDDIIVSLECMDRLLGLDTNVKTVTVEPGMKLSTLSTILSSIKYDK